MTTPPSVPPDHLSPAPPAPEGGASDEWSRSSLPVDEASGAAPITPPAVSVRPSIEAEAGGHPLYLISACCMLVGCFVVQAALNGGGVEGVFKLSLTLIAYEMLLAGAAWVLLQLRFARNLMQLLALAVLFFADPTFTYFRLVVTNVTMGLELSLALLLLAAGKLFLLHRAAPGWRAVLTPSALGLAAAGFVLNLAVPILPALSAQWGGRVDACLYAAWYIGAASLAFALPRLIGFLREANTDRSGHPRAAGRTVGADASGSAAGGRVLPVAASVALAASPVSRAAQRRAAVARRWRDYLCFAPLGVLALRLVILHWLYNEPLHACYIAPLLLACAVRARSFLRQPNPTAEAWLQVVFLTGAVCFSLGGLPVPQPFAWATPWRLTWLLSAVVLGAAAVEKRGWVRGTLAGVAAGIGLLTANPEDLTEWFHGNAHWNLSRLIPDSPLQWGLVSITAAFALLVAGLGWSLLQARRTAQTQVRIREEGQA